MHMGKTAPGAAGAPVKTASKSSSIDPSNFLVVLIAALILVYGANRAVPCPALRPSSQLQQSQGAAPLRFPCCSLAVLSSYCGQDTIHIWLCPRKELMRAGDARSCGLRSWT